MLIFREDKHRFLITKLLSSDILVRNRLRVFNFICNNVKTFEIQEKNYVLFPLGGISTDLVANLRISLKKYDFNVLLIKKGILKSKISENLLSSVFLGNFLIIELNLSKNSLLYCLNIFFEILEQNFLSNFELFFLLSNKSLKNILTVKSNKQLYSLLKFNYFFDFSLSSKILIVINNFNRVLLLNFINIIFIFKYKIKNN